MTFRLNEDLKRSTKTASHTLTLEDLGTIVEFNSASNLTLTIPDDSAVDFPDGAQIVIARYGTGTVQVTAPGSAVFRSSEGNTFLTNQYSLATLIKRTTNEWYLVGDLSAS